MRKYCMLVICLLFVMFGWSAIAAVRPYAQSTTNQVWYILRKGIERFEWVDHNSKTNIGQKAINATENIRTSNQRYGITVDPQLNVVEYEVFDVGIENWSIDNICPGKYDMVNGQWYFDLTDQQKTDMWVAYTNAYTQAYFERRDRERAEAEAPAKFDVSKTPEEYRAELLGDRDYDELMPAEKRNLNKELAKYRMEWTRINDPEAWWQLKHPVLPSRNRGRSEQDKIRSYRKPLSR